MALNKLNPDTVKKATKPGVYGDGGNLFLRVTGVSRFWFFKYMIDGKSREMGLGAFPDVSLKTAREKATEARRLKAAGIDPIQARDSARALEKADAAKAVTFKYCAEAYIEAHKGNWSAKHTDQWVTSLADYVYPTIGALPVAKVDRGHVTAILDPIWKDKTETASRVRNRVELVLDWARARDYRTGENPARYRGGLKTLYPRRSKAKTVKHLAAIPYEQLPTFFETLKASEGIAISAMLFGVLTAARPGEVTGCAWTEIDLAKALWIVPAARMKGGREHRVPLSTAAVALLQAQFKTTGGKGLVFPGRLLNKPLSPMVRMQTLKRLGYDDATAHGMRSSFRTWASEQTNYARELCEMCLAHALDSATEAAYQRSDMLEKRRSLMEAWGKFCTTPAVAASNVTPIGRRA